MMHIQYELENFTVKQKSRICVLLDSMFKHLLFNILLMDFFFSDYRKGFRKNKSKCFQFGSALSEFNGRIRRKSEKCAKCNIWDRTKVRYIQLQVVYST